MFKRILLFTYLTFLCLSNSSAQSGVPDSTFGTNGSVLVNASFPYFKIASAFLQPDGKIILAGSIENSSRDFLLIRYTADGQLDNSFGTNGFVTTSFGKESKAMKVVLMKDGDLVVMGSVGGKLTFVRYTSQGLPSNKFYQYYQSYTDHLYTSIASGLNDAKDMLEDTAGNIIFVGGEVGGPDQLSLNILKPDGQTYTNGLKPSIMPVAATGGNTYYYSMSMLKQDDGRIIIGGISRQSYNNRKLFLTRILPNGRVDSSFGTNGVSYQPKTIDNYFNIGTEIHFDNKGNIVMTSSSPELSGTVGEDSVIVSRFTKDGRPDSTFGDNGRSGVRKVAADYWHPRVTNSFVTAEGRIGLASNTHSDWGHQMTVQLLSMDGQENITVDNNSSFEGNTEIVTILNQPDGKMVIVGHALVDGRYCAAVRRVNANGTADLSFGKNGMMTTVVNGTSTFGLDYGYAMQVTAEGKLQVAGVNVNGPEHTVVLAQLNADGTMDKAFGNGGLTFANSNQRADYENEAFSIMYGKLMAMASDQSGNTYVMVSDGNEFNHEDGAAVLKFTADGKADLQFGVHGRKTFDLQENKDEYGMGIVVQPDGKPVVGIYVSPGTPYLADDNGIPDYLALVRLTTKGGIDSSYGTNGIMKDPILIKGINGFYLNAPQLMAIQKDGKINVVGKPKSEFPYYFMSRRYTMDGQVDSSFSLYNIDYGNVNKEAGSSAAVIVQPDGKVIVAGRTISSISKGTATRINDDGKKDLNYGTNGVAVSILGGIGDVSSVALQQDGKVLVLGENMLIRFNQSGVIDNTFGGSQYGFVYLDGDSLSQVVMGKDDRILLVGMKSGKIIVKGLRNVTVDCSVHKAFAGRDTSICDHQPVVLGEPAKAGTTYTWSPSGYLSSASAAQPVLKMDNYSNAKVTYSVTETYTDGCSATDTVTVHYYMVPWGGAANSREICVGDTVDIGAADHSGSTVYSWTSQPAGFTSAAYHPLVSPETTTTYFVQMANVDTLFCATKDTITITVNRTDKPLIRVSGDVLNVTNTEIGVVYNWQMTGDNVKWSTVGNGVSYTATQSGVYRVNATGDCQIYSDTIRLEVSVPEVPENPETPGAKATIGVYPNPATGGVLNVTGLKAADGWERATVMSLSGGKAIATYDITGRDNLIIDVSELDKGYYLVVLRKKNGKAKSVRFLKM